MSLPETVIDRGNDLVVRPTSAWSRQRKRFATNSQRASWRWRLSSPLLQARHAAADLNGMGERRLSEKCDS
jgi:hypothetical protein